MKSDESPTNSEQAKIVNMAQNIDYLYDCGNKGSAMHAIENNGH